MATLDSQLRRYRRAMNMQSINDAIQQELVNIAATDESKLEDIATRKNRIAALRESLLTSERNRKLIPADTPELTALDEMTKKQIALDNAKSRKVAMVLQRGNEAVEALRKRRTSTTRAKDIRNELFNDIKQNPLAIPDNSAPLFRRIAKAKSLNKLSNELFSELQAATVDANNRRLRRNMDLLTAIDTRLPDGADNDLGENILFDESKPARRPSDESQLKIPITLFNGVVVEFSQREHNEIMDPSASPTLTKAKQYAAALKVNPGNTKDPKKIMDKIRVAIGEKLDPKSRISIKS